MSLQHDWWPRTSPAHTAAGSALCPTPGPLGIRWQQNSKAHRGGNLRLEVLWQHVLGSQRPSVHLQRCVRGESACLHTGDSVTDSHVLCCLCLTHCHCQPEAPTARSSPPAEGVSPGWPDVQACMTVSQGVLSGGWRRAWPKAHPAFMVRQL